MSQHDEPPNLASKLSALHVEVMNKHDLWHRRFGHMFRNGLVRMAHHDMTDGLDITDEKGDVIRPCAVCIMGKHQRKTFPSSGNVYDKPMQLVHMDTQGPIGGSYGLSKYINVFVDESSHFAVTVFTDNKFSIPKLVIAVLKRMSQMSGQPLLNIRTDRGTEFVNSEVKQYLNDIGAIHQPVPAETQQQNGTAERKNKTLQQRGRCIRLDAELPLSMWVECVKTACDLLNMSACAGRNKTPAELFLGNKPCVAPLKVPGCLAYVWLPKHSREHKFASCSIPGALLGYEPFTKAYRVLRRKNTRYSVVVSRDVICNENVKGFPVLQDPRYKYTLPPVWASEEAFQFNREVQLPEEPLSEKVPGSADTAQTLIHNAAPPMFVNTGAVPVITINNHEPAVPAPQIVNAQLPVASPIPVAATNMLPDVLEVPNVPDVLEVPNLTRQLQIKGPQNPLIHCGIRD